MSNMKRFQASHSRLAAAALCLALVVPGSVSAQDETLVPMNVLSPELALEIAQATRAACRAQGDQVAE